MSKFTKIFTPGRIIAFGFAALILVGSLLLMLPVCTKEGVSLKYIDALYTAASAVCVTGLVSVDIADTFTWVGQTIVLLLIQMGGLGVSAIGAGIILAVGKRISFRGHTLVKEGMNLDSAKDMAHFVKSVFLMTLAFELTGAVLSFIVFSQDFPPGRALFISIFHSVSAFNNAGFDVLGGFQSLSAYQGNVMLNLVTCALIIFGGIGFLVMREMISTRFKWKSFSMHTKVVLTLSLTLIVTGTLIIKATEDITWLGALFLSVSTRTAGFSTFSLANFTRAGLFALTLFMFIGASPGSTGGGIKTTTFFALLQGIKSSATNKAEKAFCYTVPKYTFKKAAVITLLGLSVIMVGTYLMLVMNPQLNFVDVLFETVSAFGTVGLSTGITPLITTGSKALLILIMYIGRLGPMTIATLWHFSQGDRVLYPTGNISIG